MSGELMTVLSDDVEAVEAAGPSLSDDDLRTLYDAMVTVRVLDERCLRLQRAGRIGFYVPSIGQEAASVGAVYAFNDDDWIFPSYRDPGMFLLRGGSLKSFLDQLFGNSEDLSKGRQMPNHHSLPDGRFVSISSPVGTQIVQAAGCGIAIRIRGDQQAVLVSFGDGATSQNDFHTGLNFAGVFGAPVVFLCQNNQWAISQPRGKQTASATLAQKAVAYGFEGVRVDGNDVLAVYKAVAAAREKAVQGGGPTLIEALTYRCGPHSSNDDPSKYRNDEEVREWLEEKDPIGRFRQYLERRGIWDAAWEEKVVQRAKQRVADEITAAEAVSPPSPDSLFTDVYAELPWMLQEQRQALARERSEEVGDKKKEEGCFPL